MASRHLFSVHGDIAALAGCEVLDVDEFAIDEVDAGVEGCEGWDFCRITTDKGTVTLTWRRMSADATDTLN